MNVNDLKTRLDCVHKCTGGKGFGDGDHVREDLWFREHERELIAAAKARQAASAKSQGSKDSDASDPAIF